MLETLRGLPVGGVFADFNADAGDDPGGVGTSPGSGFAVQGLDAQAGDPDGFVGRVIFPVTVGDPGVLAEDHVDAGFGMPMDLNSDGVIDKADHAGNYRLLPVRVRVEWSGPAGDRFVELDSLLSVR
jgi:hypothetical protein